MIDGVAAVIVVLAAFYLIGLAVASVISPTHTRRFLESFASTAGVHYLEMLVRLLVGIAFIGYSPHMLWPKAFWVFGWLLVISTAVLMLIPWRWHRRFARKVVPPITRHTWLFGLVSLPLGGGILFAVFFAP